MITHLINGLDALGNGQAIIYLVAGSLIGMVLGVIPGLGGAVILSIVLAFIYHISVTGVLCLFLATNAGSYLSSSVAAILLNMPAHPESFAVTLDGYPMSRKGEPGRAIGISASATCVGGLMGCVALVGLLQIVNTLATVFHPPEYVGLIVLTMVLIATLGTDLMSKAMISVGLGLLLASVGQSLNGVERFTFGTSGLLSGLSLVAVVLGTIALPQMVLLFGTGTATAHQDMLGRSITPAAPVKFGKGMAKQVMQGLAEPLRHPLVLTRAALVGVVTGVVPGIGAFTANFMSYGIAQNSSRKRGHLFGTGIPEGVIAAEGSSLSKEAGHMIPLIGLGIPGGVGGALFLAALTIKDIAPGYGFVGRYPTYTYEMVWIIVFGGLIGQAAAVLLAPLLARVTIVPGPILLPFVVTFSVVGTFVSTSTYFDVMEMLVFCVVGLALRRLKYSLASFVIGLVLGGILETNIYQTHAIYPGFTFLTQRPLADVLFAISIVFIIFKSRHMGRRGTSRLEARKSPAQIDLAAQPDVVTDHPEAEFPLLGMVVSVMLSGVGLACFVYSVTSYAFNAAVLPCVGSALVAIFALWRSAFDVPHYFKSRRSPAKVIAASDPGGEVADARFLADETPELLGSTAPASSAEATAEVRPGDKIVRPLLERAWGRHGEYSRELAGLLWIAAAIGLCYLFGFAPGVALFCGSYAILATRRVCRTWRMRLLFAALSAAPMWAVTYWICNTLHVYFLPVVNL